MHASVLRMRSGQLCKRRVEEYIHACFLFSFLCNVAGQTVVVIYSIPPREGDVEDVLGRFDSHRGEVDTVLGYSPGIVLLIPLVCYGDDAGKRIHDKIPLRRSEEAARKNGGTMCTKP
jgi:hypothetical protein